MRAALPSHRHRRRVGRILSVLTVLLSLLAGAAPALAHKASDSPLSLTLAGDGRLEGRWDIALRDLDTVLELDADGNGEITWGEVRTRHAEIAALAAARLELSGDGRPCEINIGAQQVDALSDGAYSVLPLAGRCPPGAQKLGLNYRLFADTDPQHRGLLRLQTGTQVRSAVLDPQAGPQTFDLAGSGVWRQFFDYLHEGIWHIWIGFDHILFLLSLLLPAVLVWRAGGASRAGRAGEWQPARRFADGFWDVLRIVTAFTVAHSITLSLAALEIVTLPSRWVESAIAASVVLAALNNLRPLVGTRRWMVAFGFGLVHGFGFASVLQDLGLPAGTLVQALLGFNIGVELGQLAIVVVFLPLAHALRRTLLYRRGLMWGGSLAIALLALAWLFERAFGLELPWP